MLRSPFRLQQQRGGEKTLSWTISNSNGSVSLPDPYRVSENRTNSTEGYVFWDGTFKRQSTGMVDTSLLVEVHKRVNGTILLEYLENLVSDRSVVTVSGLDDSEWNRDWHLVDITGITRAGWCGRYIIKLTLLEE